MGMVLDEWYVLAESVGNVNCLSCPNVEIELLIPIRADLEMIGNPNSYSS